MEHSGSQVGVDVIERVEVVKIGQGKPSLSGACQAFLAPSSLRLITFVVPSPKL